MKGIIGKHIREIRFPGWRGHPSERGRDIPQIKEDMTIIPLTLKEVTMQCKVKLPN